MKSLQYEQRFSRKDSGPCSLLSQRRAGGLWRSISLKIFPDGCHSAAIMPAAVLVLLLGWRCSYRVKEKTRWLAGTEQDWFFQLTHMVSAHSGTGRRCRENTPFLPASQRGEGNCLKRSVCTGAEGQLLSFRNLADISAAVLLIEVDGRQI